MLTFLIARLSSSLPCGTRTQQLGFLRFNASQMSYSFSSAVKSSESNDSEQNLVGSQSFTVSYLVNSLGMSVEVAEELSKRFQLKDPDKADSVLKLLRSHGFSDAQLSKLVKHKPRLLSFGENNLLPKLRFFQSIGFSASEIQELLSSNPILLHYSLENRIIPYFEGLKSVLGDHGEARRCLKGSFWSTSTNGSRVTNIFPNVKFLRGEGVHQSSVVYLLSRRPALGFMDQSMFVEYVKFVKGTGIEPCKAIFVHALLAVTKLSKSTWESKLDMFERCGWSKDLTLLAFSKSPYVMTLSEKKITSTMKFLVKEMGLRLEDIAGCPAILGYSLKQRIIPRWSVVKILKTKGLVKENVSPNSVIMINEKMFLENFVIKFQENVPQLLKFYRGELGSLP